MPVLLAPEKFEEAVEPVRELGRRVTGFCEERVVISNLLNMTSITETCERVRDGKASVFCRLLLEVEEASLREASKERIEARFLMMPLLQLT